MKNLIKKYEEFIRYLIIGVLTTLVSLFTYFMLTMTILNPTNAIHLQIANIISFIISVTFSYITNRLYVFKSKNKNKFKEIISFYLSRLSTLIIDMVIMYVGVSLMSFNDKIVKIVSQIIVIILNYVLSKVFVFNNNIKVK